MIDLFRRHPKCEFAEPNYIGQSSQSMPNDTFFYTQWHLNNTGQTGGTVDADIDAVEGWQITRGSTDIVVAVLDSGIDANHTDFQGRLLPGFDFINNDDDPAIDNPPDVFAHGMWVSGILAANADNSVVSYPSQTTLTKHQSAPQAAAPGNIKVSSLSSL